MTRITPTTVAAHLAAALLVPGLAACGAPDARPPEADDAAPPSDSAQVLAARAMQALGGQGAWESARFLSFRWIVEREGQSVARSHAWDRYTGRYRVEYDRDGTRQVAIFDVDEIRRDPELWKVPAGEAWADGRRLEGAAADAALAQAYRIFINDSYWLLMPFKWTDPGVHLSYEGRQMLDDRQDYAVLHLSFEPDLGVTNDEYWAYVDPATGIMAAWRYKLQGQGEAGPIIWWRDWQRVGPIRLAADRVWPDGQTRIRFEALQASAEVPEGAFAPPGS